MTVESVLSLLRRRWLPLLLCLVAGLAGGIAHTATSDEVYTSSARLFVNIPAAHDTQEALQGVQLSSGLVQSYAAIVTSRSTAEQIKSRLGLDAPAGEIAGALSAAPEKDTLIIDVSASDADPARAQAMAQAAAVVLNDTVQRLEQDRTPASAVEASIIDAANRPSSPVSPRPLRDALLGLLLGLLGGLALALLLDALDRSVKAAVAAERLVAAPALAVVPRIRDSKGALAGGAGLASSAGEAYRALRTSLRFVNPDEPLRTLLVTSPDDGEGKTTTAANLAMALAQDGQKVVLVDADLRRAGATKLLGVPATVGLTSVMNGSIAVDAALQSYRDEFAVLPAGPLPSNPAELLGSERMRAVLEELADIADIVVVDAPPVLPVTDAVVLSACVDGTALVVRHGKSHRAHVAEAARRLSSVGANVVGFVFNGVPRPTDDYYYAAAAEAPAPRSAAQAMRVATTEL